MAPLIDPGTRPRVFVTLATTGSYPTASSVGNVIRDPDPTTVLTAPAAVPAARIPSALSGVMLHHPISPRPHESHACNCHTPSGIMGGMTERSEGMPGE